MKRCPRCKAWNENVTVCHQCNLNLTMTYKPPAELAFQPPAPIVPKPIECPFCHTVGETYTRNEITSAGIIVMVLLLLFCLPLFWVGLLIREDKTYCRACRMKF